MSDSTSLKVKCELYDKACEEINNLTTTAGIDVRIWRLEKLLKFAKEKRSLLEEKDKIAEIRSRVEKDKENLCDTTRQRFKDIETLLAYIDKNEANYKERV